MGFVEVELFFLKDLKKWSQDLEGHMGMQKIKERLNPVMETTFQIPQPVHKIIHHLASNMLIFCILCLHKYFLAPPMSSDSVLGDGDMVT